MKTTIQTALISVTDKTHLLPFAQYLVEVGVKLISTGGTAKVLMAHGVPVTPIEEITGNPEAFGGRMKSISFEITSGILFRRGHPQDEVEAGHFNIPKIDLVVCNLYRFEDLAGQNQAEEVLVEEIDIGGPLMIRAAAKNFQAVTVLTDPLQYEEFINHHKAEQGIQLDFRRKLASQAFDRIARYDIAIAEELGAFNPHRTEKFLALFDSKPLRYGENPHQAAKLFQWNNSKELGLAPFKVLQGKELSYNNILDADAAWKCMSDVHSLDEALISTVVVKHGNPCGLAQGKKQLIVLNEAWKGDEVSSFGGIVAMNCEVTKEVADFFKDRFVEIIMAPSFSHEAKIIFSVKKNLRLIEAPIRPRISKEITLRSFHGGVLMQEEDEQMAPVMTYTTQTKMAFTREQSHLISFGIVACKHLKSNGIALVGQENGISKLVGAGMGQPNRLDSLHLLAAHRAQKKESCFKELILISDAFFPFSDSIDAANKYGIKYIVQPGGSIRDQEVIDKANEYGMAMIFTGERHFRH